MFANLLRLAFIGLIAYIVKKVYDTVKEARLLKQGKKPNEPETFEAEFKKSDD